MINVVIADRNYLTKEGFKCLVSRYNEVKVVAQASTGQELMVQLHMWQPEVLVIDYDQPGAFHLDDVVSVSRNFPNTRILVISDNQRKHEVLTAMEFGVSYLLKECEGEEIIEAIHATAKGEKFYCAKVIENILEKRSAKDCKGLFLTSRELEIVKLVAEGHTTAEIAEMLCRSVHTINTHRKNIMNKLGLSTPSELVMYAIRKGIIAA